MSWTWLSFIFYPHFFQFYGNRWWIGSDRTFLIQSLKSKRRKNKKKNWHNRSVFIHTRLLEIRIRAHISIESARNAVIRLSRASKYGMAQSVLFHELRKERDCKIVYGSIMFEQIWEFIMSLVTVVLSWFGIELGKSVVLVEEHKDSQVTPQVLQQVMPQDPQESNEAQLP